MTRVFKTEAEFEEALIEQLQRHGWGEVLRYPTEEDLIQNWANILSKNNQAQDRLGSYPLTKGEMAQIFEQVNGLRTPMKLNGFINGKEVRIVRDHPEALNTLGKEITLKIFDRHEISAGDSCYQIAQQPRFTTKSEVLGKRRGDLMLLINGMPVFHIELKGTGIPVSQATKQIKTYARSGVFTGLFSLVQIFVAMNPTETKYFTNPGPDGTFNESFFFHWANQHNVAINEWHEIAATLLSIPLAHQLIGFYTIADTSDGVLKVLRSYQYHAVNAISDRVARMKWDDVNPLGGYIWHTTGSGKTMTSFKAAQLMANSGDVDKVVFLMDRIELGTQSLQEYRAFAEVDETVQGTEDTQVLISKLKSNTVDDTLIVTSIQKMSNIYDGYYGLKGRDLEAINKKRMVCIIDECHRSTFGDMLITIKENFKKAVFFGFTGTPIKRENEKCHNTTTDVFGDNLHAYTIADGIRDGNVLGFDIYKVATFRDKEVKKAVALEKAKAVTVEEAMAHPKKREVYEKYMRLPMVGHYKEDGTYVKGVEDYVSMAQYGEVHRDKVLTSILEDWPQLSVNGKFHAILATSSIPEAIAYYRLFKEQAPYLKVTALFDPSLEGDLELDKGYDMNQDELESDRAVPNAPQFKEEALVELIEDYNARYGMQFTLATWQQMKRDIAARLAHKVPYRHIETDKDKQLDILIVVNQMLTGFDSKWVNTLYLDKVIRYENIIQAFSRTNRLFGNGEKPFGIIKWYRKPHTMERNVHAAIRLYSEDKPLDLFVVKLHKNIERINYYYGQIRDVFENDGIEYFERLPSASVDKAKFVELFNQLSAVVQAARIQGLDWSISEYTLPVDEGVYEQFVLELDEPTYDVLLQRYKELQRDRRDDDSPDVPYDLKGYLVEHDLGVINEAYMNEKFRKYIEAIYDHREQAQIEEMRFILHSSFAYLSQEEQKFANIILHDIERGTLQIDLQYEMRDYINQYMQQSRQDEVHQVARALGIPEEALRNMVDAHPTDATINEYGRFDKLKQQVNREYAKPYFEEREGVPLKPKDVNQRIDQLLRKFLIHGTLED